MLMGAQPEIAMQCYITELQRKPITRSNQVTEHMARQIASRLTPYLTSAYALLVIYATLYPLSGWRDTGLPFWNFLVWQWPRYWTSTDVFFNVLVYVPLGFLLATLFSSGVSRGFAALLAVLLVTTLSLGLESIQNWLPTRDPAMLDFASNTLGGILGALLAIPWGKPWLNRLGQWQHRHIRNLPGAELGILLLLLWLGCQLFPVAIPLGMGDVRYLLGLVNVQHFDPLRFQVMATAVIAANLLAAGLLCSLLPQARWQVFVLVPCLFLLSCLLRAIGQLWQGGLLGGPFPGIANALIWAGPAWQDGAWVAGALLLLTLFLPINARILVAGLALLVATVLINLTPADPYSPLSGSAGLPRLFFNVQNLAHGLAALWPFLALPYLLWVNRRL